MKTLKTTLFSLLLVTFASLAFGQGQINFYYNTETVPGVPPLRTQCTTGTPLPDGTVISIYWDNNNNGPDVTDVQPEIGIEYGQANYVTLPMNGVGLGLGAGYFVNELESFFVQFLPTSAEVPGDTALYYLEISQPNLCIQSSVFSLQQGLVEWYITEADWTCATGAPCRVNTTPPPAALINLVASDGGCEAVHLSWEHDGLHVDGFNIYVNGTRVIGAAAAERFLDVWPYAADVRTYSIKAFNIGGESDASNSDNGDSYLLKFALDASGDLDGDSLRGTEQTIHFVRPNDDCWSRAWLYLFDVTHNVRYDTLGWCDTCLQIDFTLPDSGINADFRLLLEDSSMYFHDTYYTDTSASTFRLTPVIDAVGERDYLRPDRFGIAQNYPNPFNPETRIVFNVPQQAEIKLHVYNVMGQLVRTLASGNFTPGQHEVMWDGRNDGGAPVSAGLYLYRLEAPGVNVTKKMLLMK